MKYARMFNQYRYKMQKRPDDFSLWPRDGNIGDCIQCIAVENIYKKANIDIKQLLLVNRDDLKTYDGEACKLVMQSWFGDYAGIFPLPWSEKIIPIFLGFHLSKINNTRERFLREKIYENMVPYQPIGCRDRSTAEFLSTCGLKTYFSGCMTLTFDKRIQEPKNGKVFIVDLTTESYNNLPEHIKQMGDTSITHFYYWNEYPVTEKGAQEFEKTARNILDRYRHEARLVITSKIHVAMPCIAIGIPVIFINEDVNNERFDVLQGLLPIYKPSDMNLVNWNPAPINIDDLKKAIIENAIATILDTKDKNEKRNHLIAITDRLKPISYQRNIRSLILNLLKNTVSSYKNKIKMQTK